MSNEDDKKRPFKKKISRPGLDIMLTYLLCCRVLADVSASIDSVAPQADRKISISPKEDIESSKYQGEYGIHKDIAAGDGWRVKLKLPVDAFTGVKLLTLAWTFELVP